MRIVFRNSSIYLSSWIVLTLFLVTGCSLSAPPSLEDFKTNIQSQQILTDTPFFPQEEYQCGPAALATILTREGISVKPSDLTSKVYLPARKGSLQLEMIAAARSYGLIPYSLDPSLTALIRQLAAGKPVLVLQNLSFDWYPKWHYAVVIGYDLQKKLVYLRSGTHKKIRIPFNTFERTWARASNWGVVVFQPGELPKEADYQKYLTAVHQLERTGKHKAAISGYKTAHKLWPEEATPLFALGNLQYQRKDYHKAVSAFQKAVKRNPKFSQAWNNLAFTLMTLNRTNEALTAIQTALRLNPDSIVYQNSYKEISASIPSSDLTK